MDEMVFSFSDTIAGYLDFFDRTKDVYGVKTSDGRPYEIRLKQNTYAMLVRNLDEPYIDCTAQMRDMLTQGRYFFTYGVFYPEGGKHVFEAQFVVFVGRKPGDFLFERPDWWIKQINSLGDFYLEVAVRPGGDR